MDKIESCGKCVYSSSSIAGRDMPKKMPGLETIEASDMHFLGESMHVSHEQIRTQWQRNGGPRVH